MSASNALTLYLVLGLLVAASNRGAGKWAWWNLAAWPYALLWSLPWVMAWFRLHGLVMDRWEREARG